MVALEFDFVLCCLFPYHLLVAAKLSEFAWDFLIRTALQVSLDALTLDTFITGGRVGTRNRLFLACVIVRPSYGRVGAFLSAVRALVVSERANNILVLL